MPPPPLALLWTRRGSLKKGRRGKRGSLRFGRGMGMGTGTGTGLGLGTYLYTQPHLTPL